MINKLLKSRIIRIHTSIVSMQIKEFLSVMVQIYKELKDVIFLSTRWYQVAIESTFSSFTE